MATISVKALFGYINTTTLLVVASTLTVSACSNSAVEHESVRDTRVSAPRDSGVGDVQLPPGLRLLWRVVESVAPGTRTEDAGLGATANFPPMAGVRVCVYGRHDLPCVTTHADGTFTIGGLKPLEQVSLTCEKDGYVGSLRSIEAASTDMDGTASPIVMGKKQDGDLGLGIPIETDKGAASVFVLGPVPDGGLGLSHGAKLSLSPASGMGPFFTDSHNLFDKSANTMIGGLGFYFNLDEGDYTLTVDDPNADCAPVSFPFGEFGIPQAPRSVKFKVLANFATDQLAALCTAKSAVKIGADAAP
jgi:hypothetical protein